MEKFARYYVKIDKALGANMSDPNINEGRGLTSLARLVYFSLGQARMQPNSRVSMASYQIICELSGISSHQTIRKCLKELEANGFLISNTSKGQATSYLLLKGIFFGKEELETTSLSVEPTSTPSVEASRTSKHVLSSRSTSFSSTRSKYLQKLQQDPPGIKGQENVVVFFNKKDTREENSTTIEGLPFSIRKLIYEDPNQENHLKKIPIAQMQYLIDRYGVERVEEKIILLSFEYKLSVKPKGVDNPVGLLCSALRENYIPSEKHQKYINYKLLELRGLNQIEIEDQEQFKKTSQLDQYKIHREYMLTDDALIEENDPTTKFVVPQIPPILDIRMETNKSLGDRLSDEWNSLTERYSPDQLDELETQAKEKFGSKAWALDRKKLVVIYFKSFVEKKEIVREEKGA